MWIDATHLLDDNDLIYHSPFLFFIAPSSFIFQGGYNLGATAESVCEVIRVLLGDPPKQLSLGDEPINECARESIANVIDYHASNWPILALNVDVAEFNF